MSTKKAVKEKEGIEVITLEPNDELVSNRLYSNFVQVANSPYDFALKFCDAPAVFNQKNITEGVLSIPIVAEIVIPFNLMPNLIKTLQIQYEKHQKKLREITNKEESEK